jgi:predicted RNA-binding Zn-ribbon protein involved in translation (DUF1610 family)
MTMENAERKKKLAGIVEYHGTRNLSRCPECGELAMTRETGMDDFDTVYYHECHFCGYNDR